MQETLETQVWTLGWEDPLKEGMANHSSILAWRIPWTEEPGGLQSNSVQSFSRIRLFATPWIAAHQASLSITIFRSSLRLKPIQSVMPSSHLILSHPLLLLPWIFPSIRVISNESGGQSIGVSASASVSPMTIQGWFPLGLSSLISLQSNGLSRVFSSTTVQKHKFFGTQPSLWSNSHPYMTTGKTIALTIQTFVGKVMSLLFKTLSRFVIVFLLRSKRLWISWLQSPSRVILEVKKIKSVTVSIVSPSICHEVMGDWMPWSSFFECWVLSQLFHSPLSSSSRGSWVPLHFMTFSSVT